jgi:hypothetical protein
MDSGGSRSDRTWGASLMKATECGWAAGAALLGCLSALACEPPKPVADEPAAAPDRVVLARVGDETVTVDDLGWVPARTQPSSRLEMLVMRKLAAQEARRRGLDRDPKARQKLAEFRFSALMWEETMLRNALYNSIRLGLVFNDEELRAQYAKTLKRYLEPQWAFRHRKFASEAEAHAASQALGASGRLDPAQSLAIGPVPAATLPVVLAPLLAQFQKPGDRQVVNWQGEWWVFELQEHLAAAPLQFEWVRDQVDQDLRAVRAEAILNDELARLRAEQVVLDETAIAAYEKEKAEVTAAARAHRSANQPDPQTPTPAPATP